MNAGRWEEVKALLAEVQARLPEARDRFLDDYPQADAELKSEVARLLQGGPALEKFLEPPPKAAIDAPMRRLSLAFAGSAIGDFELLEEEDRKFKRPTTGSW